MFTIGIRVETTQVNYVIIEGSVNNPKIKEKNKLKSPISYELHDSLVWYRKQIIAICEEFQIQACGIRTAEPFSRTKGAASKDGTTKRCNIEGVIIEAVASIGRKVFVGPNSTISSLINSKSAKKYLNAEDFRGIDNWTSLSDYIKEAALAGVAALALIEDKQ